MQDLANGNTLRAVKDATHSDEVTEAVKGMGGSASTEENVMGGVVIGIAVADVAANLVEPGESAVTETAVKEGGEMLSRRTVNESFARLTKKSAQAAASNIGIHGVFATAATDSKAVTQAARSDVEKVFKVHNTPTNADTLHRTVELPNPVTKEVVDLFNALFR